MMMDARPPRERHESHDVLDTITLGPARLPLKLIRHRIIYSDSPKPYDTFTVERGLQVLAKTEKYTSAVAYMAAIASRP